ncbi:AraC family transcriptional regulator ligand-binding domain-containing protein [Roseateles asaccharophilus]|uniref:AraC-like DNA-binding protein n=1 Tax=Roseateles asaccharophilus TaxID=582607 RepID=A0ABU2AAI7_9BURK|nr:AraC family transcriptional regulator ligand-binding domain-containing protein [Roseateles asaccharophilus]MDR7334222.1 AraC-like DNA-binding protein [Roseateles asaccharophilus]
MTALLAPLDMLRGEPADMPPYEIDTACLPATDHAALLAEFAHHRGIALPWPQQPLISPRELLALTEPLRDAGADSAFALGQLLLPGHYGLASQALMQAGELVDLLRLLCRYAGRLTPLLTPRLLVDEQELILVWTDACGLPAGLRGFVVDLHMSAVVSLCAWRAGRRLPWRFSFDRTAPRDHAQHAVHLGTALHFGCQVDAMRLPLAQADVSWPATPGLAATALARQADPQALRRGLLAALGDRLMAQIAEAPGLEALALEAGMSPATYKRRLARHGTHYQAEVDRVRTQVALYLLGPRGQGRDAVARALGYFDGANFRRSFKRWTGLTPGHWAPG